MSQVDTDLDAQHVTALPDPPEALDVVKDPAPTVSSAVHANARAEMPSTDPKSHRGASTAAWGPSPRSTIRVTRAACVCG